MAKRRNPATGDCGARPSDFACCGTNGRNTTARASASLACGTRPPLNFGGGAKWSPPTWNRLSVRSSMGFYKCMTSRP